MSIRPATAHDADAIHRVHAGCMRDLFAGLLGDFMPPEEQRTAREESWTGPIGSPRERHALLVATLDEDVVGFTAVGPTRDGDRDPQTVGELRTVMLARAARGTGTGTALLAAGEQAMTAGGFSLATLWVVPENHAAIRCYTRGGWTPDGTRRRDDIGGRPISSVRYAKPLAPSPPA